MRLANAAGIELAERGWLPDSVVRAAIRRLLRERIEEQASDGESLRLSKIALAECLGGGEVALATREANQQHYEVPASFYRLCLGPHYKYSACFYGEGLEDRPLAEAEAAMLALTAERAGVEDGMSILDLGCGWGSFSLWGAARYPNARWLGVSNSKSQRAFILAEAERRGIANLDVVTADVNHFEAGERRFDRVVSVEMFEHVRNWRHLLSRIRSWLEPEGRLFVHHFCHREFAYPYEDRDSGDWMARNFFTGGLMPSEDWLEHYARDLEVEESWRVDGRHYAKTCNAWLENMDRQRTTAIGALAGPGQPSAERAYHRWRLFYMACAELFDHSAGQEWFVRHARLAPTQLGAAE